MGFEYKVYLYKRYSYLEGEVYTTNAYGIGVKDEKKKIVIATPLTNYIKSKFSRINKSLNSQRVKAYEIVQFLNYCLKKVKEEDSDFVNLKADGFYELNLMHGARYISDQAIRVMSGEITNDTFKRKEKELIEFYKWLHNETIISIVELENTDHHSPFDDLELGTIYPNKQAHLRNKIVDFGENRLPLVHKFIQQAEIVSPDIALGICFQFFGGLRRGEVVNLTKEDFIEPAFSSTNKKRKAYVIKVQDNQELLFTHKRNSNQEQVKVVREQSVMPFEILHSVMRRHKEQLELLDKKNKVKNKHALFIDYRTGHPINGQKYYRRFMKVKEAFLKHLAEEQHEDFNFLNENEWSTHIGRGIFTNILLERGADIVAVFVARGDKSPSSVIRYVEEKRALNFTQKVMDDLNSQLKESINYKDSDVIKATIDTSDFV